MNGIEIKIPLMRMLQEILLVHDRNRQLERENAELRKKIDELTSSKPKRKDKPSKPSWLKTNDVLGIYTARLMVHIAGIYGRDVTPELPSISRHTDTVFINEIDREKIVRIYFDISGSVIAGSDIVIVDDFLYDLIKDDEKILESMLYIKASDGISYIRTMSAGKSGTYARKIACAIRRLDRL